MTTRPETTIDTATLAVARLYLVADVTITAPALNAVVASSFAISGTAACEGFSEPPNGEPATSIGEFPQNITRVEVRLGDAGPFQAVTPTGPADTPWVTWSFAASTTLSGPVTMTARVRADRPGFTGDTGTTARQIRIDTTPPALTIDPPPWSAGLAAPARSPLRS